MDTRSDCRPLIAEAPPSGKRAKSLTELQLPRPIAGYVRAENSGDSNAISKCFAPYATVRADLDYIEGRPAIKAWKATSPGQKITPLAIDTADGTTTLQARVNGKYPGNTVVAELRFVVVDDQIVSLQIRHEIELMVPTHEVQVSRNNIGLRASHN